MATIRSLIVANLKTTLETITTGNGYSTTVDDVYVWRPPVGISTAVPYLVIAAMSEQKDQQSSPYYSCDLSVAIEAFEELPEDDPLTGWAKIERLLADIEKAVVQAPNRGQTSNTVVDTIIDSIAIKPFDNDDKVITGVVQLTVRYRHNWTDPSGVPS